MKEITFTTELSATFRHAGWWVYRIPDAPVSGMQMAGGGRLRFALPRPFDLVLCSPAGRFAAIECKLLRTRAFTVDARMVRQVRTLLDVAERGAAVWLALNFRFVRQRPPERVNRAYLIPAEVLKAPGWAEGERWAWDFKASMREGILELLRVTGGWGLPAGLVEPAHDQPRARVEGAAPPAARRRAGETA